MIVKGRRPGISNRSRQRGKNPKYEKTISDVDSSDFEVLEEIKRHNMSAFAATETNNDSQDANNSKGAIKPNIR